MRKRPASTDGGQALKRVKSWSPDHNESIPLKAKPYPHTSGRPENSDESAQLLEAKALTLLHIDSDATDYDTNATISERLWISDAEDDGDDDGGDDDDDNEDAWMDETRQQQQHPPQHSDDCLPSTERAPERSPEHASSPSSSLSPVSPPLDVYDTSISSPPDDDFFNKWYWDEHSWYDSYDSAHDSASAVDLELEIESGPAPAPAPVQLSASLHADIDVDVDNENDENFDQDLLPWSAPPEPFRPLNPYTKGTRLEVWRHEACAPWYPRNTASSGDAPAELSSPRHQQQQQRVSVSERELRATTVVALCLNHPPLPGTTHTHHAPRTLVIVDSIHTHDSDGAQLVVCRFDNENNNNEPDPQSNYVAKIYDPLYYGFAAPNSPRPRPRDVAAAADRAYCAEVAAYTALAARGGGGGGVVPRFHGAWTFQLPLDTPQGTRVSRDVRMILTERIAGGKAMGAVRTDLVPEAEKLAVVQMMMEAAARVEAGGVCIPMCGGDGDGQDEKEEEEEDALLRDIVVCGLDERVAPQWATSSALPQRVVFTNLSRATVRRRRLAGEDEDEDKATLAAKPRSPLQDCWSGALYKRHAKWLPAGWEGRLRPMQEWLWAMYEDADEYQPVPRASLEWAEPGQKAKATVVQAQS